MASIVKRNKSFSVVYTSYEGGKKKQRWETYHSYGDLPAAQQPDHRRISFGLCFSLWGKEVGRVHVRQPKLADCQLHQPHHRGYEGAGCHPAGSGQVHSDPAKNPGGEYQDPSRKDRPGH